nr:sulfotransferase 1C2A-like [Lytechinus pictus]
MSSKDPEELGASRPPSSAPPETSYMLYDALAALSFILGETKRRLADRVTEHLRSIRLNTPGLPVATHFNQPGHFINDLQVIYVARNPKDTAVSYYHFCRYIPILPTYESWDVFFEEFLANRAPQGSWFENVLPWWRKRNHPNVLFLKYEDMKKDLTGAVRQIAEFMGKSPSDDVIAKIAEASTFKAMKNNPASNPDTLIMADIEQAGMEKPKDKSFMRKGVVGDWKNYFTDDQNKRFDELYEKEMAGSGLEFEF